MIWYIKCLSCKHLQAFPGISGDATLCTSQTLIMREKNESKVQKPACTLDTVFSSGLGLDFCILLNYGRRDMVVHRNICAILKHPWNKQKIIVKAFMDLFLLNALTQIAIKISPTNLKKGGGGGGGVIFSDIFQNYVYSQNETFSGVSKVMV